MSCLGVLFALDEIDSQRLRSFARKERVDFVSEVLEETYFEQSRQWVAELDKSWDAMHRALTDGELKFGNESPLALVILGGEVLYGDYIEEDDYIITYKTPQMVKTAAQVLANMEQAAFRRRYFALDEATYGFPVDEQDFEYTWYYLDSSKDFWLRAAKANRSVIFTVDQ